MVGDGECDEGLIWESLMSASHYNLTNLNLIVDFNNLQSDGYTKEVMDKSTLGKKIESFGFNVQETDGHNFDKLDKCFLQKDSSKPNAIIAYTVKGKGVSFMENSPDWHHGYLTEEQYQSALSELETKMIKINKIKSSIYSKLGQNGACFGIGLMEKQKSGEDIFVISADMSEPVGLGRFKKTYPNNFVNIGIAEQNMIGVAAGMASEGKNKVDAQACFLSMRSCEQVRQFMGYMKYNIIAVGISSGFALTFFGNTHYAIEDLSIMRSVPGLTILSPSDAGQAVKAIIASIEINKPVYLRANRSIKLSYRI